MSCSIKSYIPVTYYTMLLFFFYKPTATLQYEGRLSSVSLSLAWLSYHHWLGLAWLSNHNHRRGGGFHSRAFFLSLLGICSTGSTGHRELPVIITDKNKQTSCKTLKATPSPPTRCCLFFFFPSSVTALTTTLILLPTHYSTCQA